MDLEIEPTGKRVVSVTGVFASTFAYPKVSTAMVCVRSVIATDIPGAPCSASARGA